MVARKDYNWSQFDIVIAYLNALLDNHKIYMVQPTGFHEGEKSQVCQLLRALYGLKQSGYLWNTLFDNKLKNMGFKPSPADPCLYWSGQIAVLIYVDNAIVAALSTNQIDKFYEDLASTFKVKIIGEPVRFLGCDITRNRATKTITISQKAYTQEILQSLPNLNPTAVPIAPLWRPNAKTFIDNDNNNRNYKLSNLALYLTLTGYLN